VTLAWIIASGVAMSALALVGGVTVLLPDPAFNRIVMPLVALAAGSLIGGALFHLLPQAVDELGNALSVYVWVAAGFVAFFALEQLLHWHHCHRPVSQHRPLGYMILVADGLHNLTGGLAVGASFLVDVRVGIITWLVAAAHEVPQELGDFGILVHSGWSRLGALTFNVASASTFLAGGLLAYAIAGAVDVSSLLAFAAGNFVYIAAADLLPEVTAVESLSAKLELSGAFMVGLVALLAIALVA
jgi:zinc and cadmium transporter